MASAALSNVYSLMGPQKSSASFAKFFHNRLFRRCQLRLAGDAEGWRLVRNTTMGGSSSGTAGAAAAGELLLLVPSLSESNMKTPAMRIASRSMIFLLIPLFWYPEATFSSLSASFTSLDMFSTL